MILYGLEVNDDQQSVFVMLDNVLDRAVFKILVSEKNVIRDIRHFLGLYDVALLYDKYRDV